MISDQWSVIRKPAKMYIVVFANLAKALSLGRHKRSAVHSRFITVLCLLLATTPLTLVAQNPSALRSVVVLDAAHGGDDSGAGLGSQPEKAYTLALSVRLRSLLAARGFQVVTTRESDTTVEADRRAEIANHADALACLSLHATEAGSGVHIFVSSLAPARDARFTAWKTAQAAWITSSLTLAGVLNSALSHSSIPVTLGRVGMPTLDSMACPAVAVEIAPQRTADAPGGESLDDPAVLAHIAEALAAALVEWRTTDRGAHQP
ncbi:MAG: N-acetylmuramoyl-L-alanine amidase family protein [Terracidiphilus sp.]